MIVVLAFNNHEHRELQVVDTSLISKAHEKEITKALNEKSEYKKQPSLWVERYDYNQFYKALEKGFIKAEFPLTIDNMLYIYHYEENSGVADSW